MESNGERNRIHVSQKTADLIALAGKQHWLSAREDKITAKGKGEMQTYWCEPKSGAGSVVSGTQSNQSENGMENVDLPNYVTNSQLTRLVDWNVDMFEGLLKSVVAQRAASSINKASMKFDLSTVKHINGHPLDEVKEIVSFPKVLSKLNQAPGSVELSSNVSSQLREYILEIAQMYRENPFHNFDHCSHVAMSTKKLLDRIATHEAETRGQSSNHERDSSHGITSDPLTQFAIIFAALIHDVDHPGVSNDQLVRENSAVAITYNGKSVAEQNSVDVAWSLLMEPRFADLQVCIFANAAELQRFRQIAVNTVLATDLFDKDLKSLRESRWEKSFSEVTEAKRAQSCVDDDSNRRATIILELVIQASDVSHTMQHFTVYKKWNMRLLEEMYDAFQSQRAAKDPTDGWYEGELWFFDNYIIPLAKKLRECGVFGVSCDEFLDYAKDNRMEWEMKGRDIVRLAKKALKARAMSSSP